MITLNGTVCAEKAVVGDYDRDGIPDLTVKFDREQVCALLEPGDAVEITVSGAVGDVRFIGTDTVRVIGKKNGNKKAVIPEYYEARNTDRVYFYHLNHLGTPQAMTDEAGNIVWQADYKPFGEVAVTTGDVRNNFRFPGQYFDAETGLHYNWHRYYDPDTGRYLTPDPIGLDGGINLFIYVRNNPINFKDLFGLKLSKSQLEELKKFIEGQEEILEEYKKIAAASNALEKYMEFRKKTEAIANAAGYRSECYKNASPEVQKIIDIHESYHVYFPQYFFHGSLMSFLSRSPVDSFLRFLAAEEIRAYTISNRLLKELYEKESREN